MLALLLVCPVASGTCAAAAPIAPTIYAFGNSSGAFGLPVSPAGDGAFPKGSLTLVPGERAHIFGSTAAGGNASGCGTYFSIDPGGGGYRVLFAFSGKDGCSPRHDALYYDRDAGALFGATQGYTDRGDIAYNHGQILRLPSSGDPPQTVHAFAGPPDDGAQQHSALLSVPGTPLLFGQTAKGGSANTGLLYAVCPDGSCFYPLHDFVESEGYQPHGGLCLIRGTELWSMTRGGASGGGSVFFFALRLINGVPQRGPITVVHVFTGRDGDGYRPEHGSLVAVERDGHPVLYGMTKWGGSGKGTIFQIDVDTQRYSTFYQFNGASDGSFPYGTLHYDARGGYLYGTTSAGGRYDRGTVFRVLPGAFGMRAHVALLHEFSGRGGDGDKPLDNVILVRGRLYGVTVYGGTAEPSPDGSKHTGRGTIFALPVR